MTKSQNKAQWKKPDRKEYILHILGKHSRKYKLIYSDMSCCRQPNLRVTGKSKSLHPTSPVWMRTALGERQEQCLPTSALVGKEVTTFPN